MKITFESYTSDETGLTEYEVKVGADVVGFLYREDHKRPVIWNWLLDDEPSLVARLSLVKADKTGYWRSFKDAKAGVRRIIERAENEN